MCFPFLPGTHDIVKVRAGHSLPQRQIDISCVYREKTTNRGFFTIIYSSANHSDITYRVAVQDGVESTTNLSITNLEQDDYQLSIYDLIDSTIPEPVPAALPLQVSKVDDTDETIVSGAGKLFTTCPINIENVLLGTSITNDYTHFTLESIIVGIDCPNLS